MWICVGEAEDIRAKEAARIADSPAGPLAVYNLEGDLYCTADTCTHAQSSLCDGYIDGDVVECVLHFAKFSIKTGAVLSLPATIPLKTYPVKVEDGRVFVDV